ncbi:MAG: flagellar protein export ATPase FliI [Alphaproteobacteria bacterium]|nr:flagellar protein export ATPase FliI [Alphaproteobacteria bacterium]MDD9919391.1 flagellar protein export ATPase FliI [Alphaproteobacteria bacterium]
MAGPLDAALENLHQITGIRTFGRVRGVAGLMISCEGLDDASMGSRCLIEDRTKNVRAAEVVGYEGDTTQLMPFGSLEGIGPGCRVYPVSHQPSIVVNNSFVGRVFNALGEPIDGKGTIATLGGVEQLLKVQPPLAGQRQAVGGRLDTGVRVFNAFLPLCKGQRMGIFSGSGVGKSVLMSMLAKYSDSDVNVIGLIGERGREVREFIEEQLGEAGMKKSIVVVATSDEPPLMRRQAAYLTMSIAEYFRDCGFNVMLMMDSVTRFAMAQREIGLSSGEPPTTRGYTPSVFAELPRLLERAGPGLDQGTISAIFTVLVEGGDMDEPVADAVRGILDGHIVLTRKLAERGHFPAVDVLQSISRMVPQCLTPEENQLITKGRQLLSTYMDMEELIRLGAYQQGSDPLVDAAIKHYEPLAAFLKQSPDDFMDMVGSFQKLNEILADVA